MCTIHRCEIVEVHKFLHSLQRALDKRQNEIVQNWKSKRGWIIKCKTIEIKSESISWTMRPLSNSSELTPNTSATPLPYVVKMYDHYFILSQ